MRLKLSPGSVLGLLSFLSQQRTYYWILTFAVSIVDVVSLVEHHAMPVNAEEGASVITHQSHPFCFPRQPQFFDLRHHLLWEG